MKLETFYRSVISAFVFISGAAAVLAVLYGVLSLIFWNVYVFATVFALFWAGQSCLMYHWDDPEWKDRPRILIRTDDEEDDYE